MERRVVKAGEVAELMGASAALASMGVKKRRATMEKDKNLARIISALTSN